MDRGDQKLGDFLLPLKSNETFEGCVVAKFDTPAVNAKSLTFTFDQFINRDTATIGRGGDADFIFYLRLSAHEKAKLRRLVMKTGQRLVREGVLAQLPTFDWTLIHVESVAFGRRSADLAPVFPGWREDSMRAAVLFNGQPLSGQLTCAQIDNKDRCAQPLVNGESLVGSRIRATGLLAIDCNDFGTARGCPSPGAQLELHPVFTLVRTGACVP